MKVSSFLIIYYIIFTILVLSCKDSIIYKPKNLRKLTEAELIDRAKKKTLYKIENPIYKNEKGEIIPSDSINIMRSRDTLTIDRYVNTDGDIKELVLRKRTEADKALENKLMVLVNALPAIEIVTIDCDNVSKKLQEAYALDQKMRQPGAKYDRGVDHQNMTIVASAIENCGVSKIKKLPKEDVEAIFFIVQHSDLKYMKKYVSMLKELAEDGKIRMSAIAAMQDRILMLEGKLQRYGTQMIMNYVAKKLEVYSLENPEYVNKRRTEVGLGPLEDYVKQFGAEFNVKQLN